MRLIQSVRCGDGVTQDTEWQTNKWVQRKNSKRRERQRERELEVERRSDQHGQCPGTDPGQIMDGLAQSSHLQHQHIVVNVWFHVLHRHRQTDSHRETDRQTDKQTGAYMTVWMVNEITKSTTGTERLYKGKKDTHRERVVRHMRCMN